MWNTEERGTNSTVRKPPDKSRMCNIIKNWPNLFKKSVLNIKKTTRKKKPFLCQQHSHRRGDCHLLCKSGEHDPTKWHGTRTANLCVPRESSTTKGWAALVARPSRFSGKGLKPQRRLCGGWTVLSPTADLRERQHFELRGHKKGQGLVIQF